MADIITRFPPSPTGFFHIGSARTALFNHLFAARQGGTMVLRFEDTDRTRSKIEYEDDIKAGLAWLGIPYEMPEVARQSERLDIYRTHVKRLLEKDLAYEGEAAADNPEKKVIRFRNPGGTITFEDLIRGTVSFDVAELGDFVIAKGIDEPLYHLAVVIDDHEMGVTHVIRGEDHISNTPRQILILEALGFARPRYAHIPLILAPDRSKLSKRHGAVSVNEYRAQGFIPEALVNYLALLGWNPGGEQEVFTIAELREAFSIERVQKGGAIFNLEKLRWFNREHLRRLSDEEYAARLGDFMAAEGEPMPQYLLPAAPILKERAETLRDAATLIKNGECSFFEDFILEDGGALLIKGANTSAPHVTEHLRNVGQILEGVPPEEWHAEQLKKVIFPYADEQGRGAVLWPLRIALSGKEKSPDPFTIAALIGKQKTLSRIAQAQRHLVE